jgi:starch synthase
MKVALSVIGKFHTFDLARELHQRGMLAGIFTGYPRFKLKGEGLPQGLMHCYPWLHGPYMAFSQKDKLGQAAVRYWEYLSRTTLDRHVAAHLPECDVFVGLSSSALESGKRAKARGARYVCDRGSTHIRVQDQLMREEHERWGLPYEPIDPRVVALEEAEYAQADAITIPSGFNLRSFVQQGVPASKLKVLPYGVNLTRFQPTGVPAADCFDIIFVGGASLRKGVPDLLAAYRQLQHPRKSLTFVGAFPDEFVEQLQKMGLWLDDIKRQGHVPQEQLKDIMSRAHVMVLPSIEEGLAMVQAQAMACGCPVLATSHTGCEDLFTDGQEGFIVPIRAPHQLAEKLQHMADHPQERDQMGQGALQRVKQAGGWAQYGERAVEFYSSLSGLVAA